MLKSTAATVVARVAADQLVFTPVNLFCFLSSMSIMEGSDPMEKLRKAYWPTYKTNLGVWSTVQLGNFALVPLEYRVLVVNVVSLGKPICSREFSSVCWVSLTTFPYRQGGTATSALSTARLKNGEVRQRTAV